MRTKSPAGRRQKMKKSVKLLKLIVLTLVISILSLSAISCGNAKDDNVLKVGMECCYQPYNWTQLSDVDGAVPINGKKNMYANGYDVKIAKKLADALGKNVFGGAVVQISGYVKSNRLFSTDPSEYSNTRVIVAKIKLDDASSFKNLIGSQVNVRILLK